MERNSTRVIYYCVYKHCGCDLNYRTMTGTTTKYRLHKTCVHIKSIAVRFPRGYIAPKCRPKPYPQWYTYRKKGTCTARLAFSSLCIRRTCCGALVVTINRLYTLVAYIKYTYI